MSKWHDETAGIGLEFRLNYSDKAADKTSFHVLVYPGTSSIPLTISSVLEFLSLSSLSYSRITYYSLSLANFSENGRYFLYGEWHTIRVFITFPLLPSNTSGTKSARALRDDLYIRTPSNSPSTRALEIILWIIIIFPGKTGAPVAELHDVG